MATTNIGVNIEFHFPTGTRSAIQLRNWVGREYMLLKSVLGPNFD